MKEERKTSGRMKLMKKTIKAVDKNPRMTDMIEQKREGRKIMLRIGRKLEGRKRTMKKAIKEVDKKTRMIDMIEERRERRRKAGGIRTIRRG